MTRVAAAAVLCLLLSCAPDPAAAPRFLAIVTSPSGDTVSLSLPLAGQRCGGAGGLLLEGIEGSQGVLIWLSPGGPDTGAFPLHDVEAAIPGRQARVVVRYEAAGMLRAVPLDSGTLRLDTASPATGSVGGSGLIVGGQRPQVEGTFRAVPIGPDTVPCRPDSTRAG